jgi:hypothetical protein
MDMMMKCDHGSMMKVQSEMDPWIAQQAQRGAAMKEMNMAKKAMKAHKSGLHDASGRRHEGDEEELSAIKSPPQENGRRELACGRAAVCLAARGRDVERRGGKVNEAGRGAM